MGGSGEYNRVSVFGKSLGMKDICILQTGNFFAFHLFYSFHVFFVFFIITTTTLGNVTATTGGIFTKYCRNTKGTKNFKGARRQRSVCLSEDLTSILVYRHLDRSLKAKKDCRSIGLSQVPTTRPGKSSELKKQSALTDTRLGGGHLQGLQDADSHAPRPARRGGAGPVHLLHQAVLGRSYAGPGGRHAGRSW